MLVMEDINILDKCIFKPTKNVPVTAKALESLEIIENEIPTKNIKKKQ